MIERNKVEKKEVENQEENWYKVNSGCLFLSSISFKGEK